MHKADSFNKYKLYLKYFYSIINFTTYSLEKHTCQSRALNFRRYRTSIKTMRGFVYNTLK